MSALLDDRSSIPEPEELLLNYLSLASIACNHKKGIFPKKFAIILHTVLKLSPPY
ncbi:hypothetical protein [cyanobacterium endosymbiont of Epithemia clementina EcSB]|uniref:hypothetical protein n=1 Tax=cyanobacterium endosymbiont of Epithemia clementina EcSB TaxID=3034674 RepID=UPI00247FD678|nr:hypothetical protein [cyanobacterium endosymbiont of Epithemia clementina EcSB]WGT66867.1 hypothetical protein P3F56_06330 [cyanobacterium endosymbiont of Epithemia clementina EcSB]